MMTKQAELKKQAYASTLKSRALSVLIYLIDRSNKELTCFPAIPTMAEQLHISVSTVKRALHELLDAGYIKKDVRFRERNKGQTSNLYTLVLFEGKPTLDDSHDLDCNKNGGVESAGEVSKENEDRTEQGICQAEHISFDILKKMQEKTSEVQTEKSQEDIDESIQEEDYQKIWQKKKVFSIYVPNQPVKKFFVLGNGGRDFSSVYRNRKYLIQILFAGKQNELLFYLWTGAGVSLIPP